jgi:GNAT superfamily N-acetyltransferase
MSLEFRPAEERDIAGMAHIRAEEWRDDAFWIDRIGRYLSGEHSPQQALAERAAFVAVEQGAVIGFVTGHRTRRFGYDGELQWINVIASRRGQGISGRLMNVMAGWFLEHGMARVCVNVSAENTAACALYARYGAHTLSEGWMAWEDARAIVARAGAQVEKKPVVRG